MSHVGNKILAGYFRTPDRQGEYIKSLLRFTGDCSVFDPTCGEGLILQQLTEGTEFRVKSYGVELDKGRAQEAQSRLDEVIQAPIESMVISHDVFSLLFLNPPYDHTIKGIGDDEKTERKEYIELVRNTRYLVPGGVIVYIIPSYRFADKKISRFLSTNFEDIGIIKFSAEDYEDYKQCVFIGKKRPGNRKEMNNQLFEFLQKMSNEEHIERNVTPINVLVGKKTWDIPSGRLEIPTFYSKIENKKEFIPLIQKNRGFQAFIERTKPRQLEIGGDPIINIAQGQLALLLASGAVNGLLGEGKTLHAVQGVEEVKTLTWEEKAENGGKIHKSRTQRRVLVKIITPSGKIRKLV